MNGYPADWRTALRLGVKMVPRADLEACAEELAHANALLVRTGRERERFRGIEQSRRVAENQVGPPEPKPTLGAYRWIAAFMFGEECEAVRFLDRKIGESERGANEPVLAEKDTMLQLIARMSGPARAG